MTTNNTLTKPQTQLPTLTPADDPYLKTAARVASESAFLKYVKGTFVFGIDGDELPLGTELVPHMEEIKIGWLKWQGGEVVEANMALWAAGHAYREDLGDLDQDLWDVDDDGKAIDPWSETATVPFKNSRTGEEFTFSTSSGGGRQAVAKLVYAWRHGVTQGKTGLPVVAIGSDTYKHKKFGPVHFPVFKIARWADEADLIAGKTEADVVDELNDAVPF
jgi:hypothetical protein